MVLKNIKGSVLVEFALVVPILILIVFGMHDIANYVLTLKNVEKIAQNCVALPQKLQTLSERNVDVKTNKNDVAKKFFSNLLEASKMIFYMNNPNLTKQNLPTIVLCWSLVECSTSKNGIMVNIPWRMFIRLGEKSVNYGKITFDVDDYKIQKPVYGNTPPLKFKNYIPVLGTTKDYKLVYKVPEQSGKILVLEVFDDRIMDNGAFLSNFIPKSWLTVHKIAYSIDGTANLPSNIDSDTDSAW